MERERERFGYHDSSSRTNQTEGISCLLLFTSTCPLKVQVSQGLALVFEIELLKTGGSIRLRVRTRREGVEMLIATIKT